MISGPEYFAHNIANIEEFDYGDFMRPANLYLTKLIEELSQLHNYTINQKLENMQSYLQFTPNWDVGSTRKKLIEDALYLDELLHSNPH